jgi:hypothetical protein
MKTLREYIDQLDEISRRDALKYAGATAAGAALGVAGKTAYDQSSASITIPNDPQIHWLISYIEEMTNHPHSRYGSKLDKIRKAILPLDRQAHIDWRTNPSSSKIGEAQERGYEAANHDKQKMLGAKRNQPLSDDEAKKFSDMAAEALQPYLRKLEQLMNQKIFEHTLEESDSQEDPIARIDRLFRD